MGAEILRYAAFTADPAGGNPAGIVLDASGLSDVEMLGIAADVGYSETAFVTAPPGGLGEPGRAATIRYFSPKAEVPFCGHATVATAVALAERIGPGEISFAAPPGTVPVDVRKAADGTLRTTLTSVEPDVEMVTATDVTEALTALRWRPGDLDTMLPPRIAFAGARHLIIAAATRARLADLDYDFDALLDYMTARDLTTVQLVWRESKHLFHARDPFPVGGVFEDPATGAAAAAFGAYLREVGLIAPNAVVTIHQGDDMGRPGLIRVELREGDSRVRVSGTAVRIPYGD